MTELEQLVRSAEQEVSRVMEICNACRYCETYCAVFPAMTRRLAFDDTDAHFLANLCHNCGACLHACQYAPPHEFAVNVPRAMASVRRNTYANYAWPAIFSALYRRNGVALAVATAAGIALFLMLAIALRGPLWIAQPGGNFYAVFPHNTMVAMFGLAFAFAVVGLAIGSARFWRGQSPGAITGAAAAEASRNVLALTYLGGGHGDGCNEQDDRFTLVRRRFHHLTFYGFVLCFASTTVATLYHYAFGWAAPYGLLSAPVVLGTIGGLGLLVGPAGLFWLNVKRHPLQGDPAQKPMDRAFIALLLGTSLSGLGLLALRATPAMATLLALHLGCVMAFFVTMPYSKFAHAVYRTAALLKWAVERRQPNRLRLSSD